MLVSQFRLTRVPQSLFWFDGLPNGDISSGGKARPNARHHHPLRHPLISAGAATGNGREVQQIHSVSVSSRSRQAGSCTPAGTRPGSGSSSPTPACGPTPQALRELTPGPLLQCATDALEG